MKALTVWQPWASLIIAGWKPHEFRGYPAPRFAVGQRIVIHAGARPPKRGEIADLIHRLGSADDAWTTGLLAEALPFLERVMLSPGMLPLSAGLGTALLGQAVRADQLVQPGITIADSDRLVHSNWGWPLSEIERFEPPVPCKGAQGFWSWPC